MMLGKTYTATNGREQIHTFGTDSWEQNNFITRLSFDNITWFSHGHHARTGVDRYHDIIDFTDTNKVSNTIVGRIEDFDPSRDEIQIEGKKLDFTNLPANVRVVEYNGEHNDPGSYPQQWLLIDTGPGNIFYSLEGARIDMNSNGGSNSNHQETHFLDSAPDFSKLKDVVFVDQFNYIPKGYTAQDGNYTNDTDVNPTDVRSFVFGSNYGDLIAAGLNDDKVVAGFGNDVVWGGSGHDTINAGIGYDTVLGGTGNDFFDGNNGNDSLEGQLGSDTITGGNGNDTLHGGLSSDDLYGGNGYDVITGSYGNDSLFGQSGDDTIFGGMGSDRIYSGIGKDELFGGQGSDIFVFMVGRDTEAGPDKRDVIQDFDRSADLIDLSSIDANKFVNGNQTLRFSGTTAHENSVWYAFNGDSLLVRGDNNGDNAQDFVIELKGVAAVSADDFIF